MIAQQRRQHADAEPEVDHEALALGAQAGLTAQAVFAGAAPVAASLLNQ